MISLLVLNGEVGAQGHLELPERFRLNLIESILCFSKGFVCNSRPLRRYHLFRTARLCLEI